ncbi:gallidermin/nisin family lantibiotic [Paenibacillus ehimensis]|uniref:Lantibiotic n=1 Tax=Paenibacillus ehimensis TaxID=79264 RepID=A0ABT8V843_9BACL|nr:gallidermin/nisin family lantibiotic [Paenibacillus ehimensis]MDO3676878.1 gallidermin/nisin family lantibiotic [Paenibacillus ehimensis]MEC0210466.1 gallidermin/nisin family lantibiotic [Paenibacillus ehimensis]
MTDKNQNIFELDVQVLKVQSSVEPRWTSDSLCTPGCTPTATLCTSCAFNCTYKDPCK